MALITCPDCKREHSDAAAACPGCGRPARIAQPTLIEETSKRWKKVQLIGVVASLFGLILMMTDLRVVGVALGLFGIGSIFVARYQMWWHHR